MASLSLVKCTHKGSYDCFMLVSDKEEVAHIMYGVTGLQVYPWKGKVSVFYSKKLDDIVIEKSDLVVKPMENYRRECQIALFMTSVLA